MLVARPRILALAAVAVCGLIFASSLQAQDQRGSSQDAVEVQDQDAQSDDFVYKWPEKPEDVTLPEADVPEKEYYAENLMNKQLPDLVLQKFLSDTPEFENKMVLIDFWATWCGPCRKAIPELNELKKEFGDKLVVLGISDEDQETVEKMEEPKMEYFSAIDEEGRLKKHVGVRGIPHVVLVDQYGFVRWQGFPGMAEHELTKEVVHGLIDTYTTPTEQ